jgi:uncharacterized membrane protein HdeD (DUF308 family)
MNSLKSMLARKWWLLLLRSLAAILFGVLLWIRPVTSVAALVLLFGAFAMAEGIFTSWIAISGRKVHDDWVTLLLEGLLGIGIGVLTLLVPGITAMALLFYIAIWAVATGVLEIVVAIRLRKEIEGEWALMLAGISSIAFGLVAVARPAAGALAVLWLISAFAIVSGVLLLVVAFKARRLARDLAGA